MQPNQAEGSAPTAEAQSHLVDIAVTLGRLVRVVRSLEELPPATLRALSMLDERRALRISEFARLDGCSQPTATALIGRLAAEGLVSRTKDPGDSRAVVVELTPAGRDCLNASRRAVGTTLAARLPSFGTDRLARLRAELTELLGELKNTAP
ncbi:MarR family winged helix-turn-helix transcriptional regulator [Nocardia sp. alder85J]|uniref:MarR family winged helix-turn-helix transcriptional regulator n=1 Tax=Nocardia sp. alder85J TaxID=2862949 RepID=UPI001CD535DA|nr:MarR family transcriptional regulator [Nocardia sp. alder85J]MCX4093475.1 MarR family transcriptional regulator [Nocardia sp. alder85J]